MRHRTSGSNPFLALSYLILLIAIVASAGAFGYKFYLDTVLKSKEAEVTKAQNEIDQATVTGFIRLRDRFISAKDILDHQVALSQYFDVLETLTLQNVRFNSLKVGVGNDRVATVTLAGGAKTFNALAAQSAALAGEKRIKRAIFSGINVSPDNTVTFTLTAQLDPSLIELSAATVAPPPSAATTTP